MKAVVVFITALFFLYFANPVFATSITISNYPSIITENPFTITASISGVTAGTDYLRVDLFKDTTSDYFGETFNNIDWYGGPLYDLYLPITIQNGAIWSGNIQGRAGSPSSTEYDGSGTYKMRLRMYADANGGTEITDANNSAVTVSISLPTPTSTPNPTPTPTPTPIPTNMPTPTVIPTPTPMPTNISTPIPAPIHTPTPNAMLLSPTPTEASSTDVLGENTGSQLTASPIDGLLPNDQGNPVPDQTKKPDTVFQIVSILVGIIFIVFCGIFTFRIIKKGELMPNDEE